MVDDIKTNLSRTILGYKIPHYPQNTASILCPVFLAYCTRFRVNILDILSTGDLTPSGTDRTPMSHMDWLSKRVTGKEDGLDFLSRFHCPSGQLKNLLVVLHTILQSPAGEKKIALVGASASYGSGSWLQALPVMLLHLGFSGVIEAFDKGREPSTNFYTFDSRTIVVHFRCAYYEGDGSEYDILADDIWFAGAPGKKKWKSTYWSQKDQSPSAVPFCHVSEGRIFSHSKYPVWDQIGCPCMRCVVEAQIPEVVRSWTLLVASHLCKKGDSNALSQMWRELDKYSVCQTSMQVHKRAILAISEQYPIHSVDHGAELGPGDLIIHDKQFQGKLVEQDYTNSVFVGIDPHKLGIYNAKNNATPWKHFHQKVYTTSIGGLVGQKYYFPPELKPRGYEPTGIVDKGMLEYKQIYSRPPLPDVVYDGEEENREDSMGTTYKAPVAERKETNVLFCTVEKRLVSIPHVCSLNKGPIDPHGYDGVWDGRFLQGIPLKAEGKYCLACHFIGPHVCGQIKKQETSIVDGAPSSNKKKKNKNRKKKGKRSMSIQFAQSNLRKDPISLPIAVEDEAIVGGTLSTLPVLSVPVINEQDDTDIIYPDWQIEQAFHPCNGKWDVDDVGLQGTQDT